MSCRRSTFLCLLVAAPSVIYFGNSLKLKTVNNEGDWYYNHPQTLIYDYGLYEDVKSVTCLNRVDQPEREEVDDQESLEVVMVIGKMVREATLGMVPGTTERRWCAPSSTGPI